MGIGGRLIGLSGDWRALDWFEWGLEGALVWGGGRGGGMIDFWGEGTG